jgi:hypothetical protein
MDLNKVAEYDDTGKESLELLATPGPWDAVRLAQRQHPAHRRQRTDTSSEVNPAGEVVWSFDRSDLVGYTIGCIQDVVSVSRTATPSSPTGCANTLKPEQWASTRAAL